jgi:hypothetical protein
MKIHHPTATLHPPQTSPSSNPSYLQSKTIYTSNTPINLILNKPSTHTTININVSFTPRLQEKLLAIVQGFQIRRHVSVDTVAPGIIKTTIRRPPDNGHQTKSHPLGQMQSLLKPGSTYVRMHIVGGGQSSCIIGTKNSAKPQSPIELAKQASQGAAIINGGYFVHKDGLISNNESQLSIGDPVGQTALRSDSAPVPDIWKEDYGHLLINDQVGLTSGPVLTLNGEQITLPDHDRMKYYLDGKENPLNKYAGALTHSSGFNERAAISTLHSPKTDTDDTVMHALVSNGDRSAGANMAEWQTLTSAGVTSLPGGRITGRQIDISTINLDGGGSVFLGTTGDSAIAVHALGGASTESTIRPVANVIVSMPERPGNRK